MGHARPNCGPPLHQPTPCRCLELRGITLQRLADNFARHFGLLTSIEATRAKTFSHCGTVFTHSFACFGPVQLHSTRSSTVFQPLNRSKAVERGSFRGSLGCNIVVSHFFFLLSSVVVSSSNWVMNEHTHAILYWKKLGRIFALFGLRAAQD